MAQQQQQTPETITITNFGGRLTRIINGDLNSGFAKFNTSWGYDPFSKPMNLTWLEKPSDITGPISNLPLTGKFTNNSGVTNAAFFLYDSGKKLYTMTTTATSASVIAIGSVAAGLGSILYNASMEFFGSPRQIYIGTETGVNKINFDGTADSFIGSSGNYVPNTYRPLKQFVGKLIFGNGNSIGAIGSTGTVTSSVIGGSYSELSTRLPVEDRVQDIDVSIDGNQLLISTSTDNAERTDTVSNDTSDSYTNDSSLYKWNGSDLTVTASTTFPGQTVSSLQTYLGNNALFSNDAFGMSVMDENNKLLSLPNNKAPLPNATSINGNFLTWWVPEVSTDSTTRYATLYYFGSLDLENPPGLYRLLRYTTTQASAQVFVCPLNVMAGNHYLTLNGSYAITTLGYGKHFLSYASVNTSGTYQNYLLSFLVTPTGTGTPQLGVYETQTQLFSKKIAVKQVRVYTEPTAANNGFQIDLIGSDGSVLTNGTATYTYAAGTDITQLQGALQRIDFNLTSAPTYAMGLRITNTGTANMTIKKVEIDIVPAGK